MSTIQKFYFHEAASDHDGILPGAISIWSGNDGFIAVSPGYHDNQDDAYINRLMDGTAGSSQALAGSYFDSANDVNTIWHRRHLSASLAAQTIAAGTWTLAVAGKVTNAAASDGNPIWALFVWRPGTGAKVAEIFPLDFGTGTFVQTTSETGSVGTRTSASGVTIQDGDILIIEWGATWEQPSANTGSLYDDGTTDPVDNVGISSAASYLLAPAALTLGPTHVRSANDSISQLVESAIDIKGPGLAAFQE